jgi:hypothetical protein
MRWVVTHVGASGRTMTFPCQGRHAFATREEAERQLRLFEPGLREKVIGAAADTLEVREVECWTMDGDPKRVYFDEKEDT